MREHRSLAIRSRSHCLMTGLRMVLPGRRESRKELGHACIHAPNHLPSLPARPHSTPLDIANKIGKSFSERMVICKVDGQLWDMPRPLEASCKLDFFDFESPEGKRVFWHSSAHILGEAAERHYGCHLCIGPPIDDGFYYEMGMGMSEGSTVVPDDFAPLESLINAAIKEKQTFERVVVTKENLLEMFKYNKYKQHIIQSKIPDGTSTTVYRCGPMIDLCVGPHIPHAGRIKAMSILKASASYFLGNQANDSLQRLYGISFPDKKQMTEYKQFLLEAAKRDHRRIGKDQVSACEGRGARRETDADARRLARNSSCSMKSPPAAASGCPTARAFTTPSPTLCAQSTASAASRRSFRLTCSTRSFGRRRVTGQTTRTTCSRSASTRRRLVSSR